jgi:Glycosyltransferase family 28 N-terminal domain
MRVLIVAVGSRGDVAPFTGLGTALQADGHSVAIAGYEMFADLVTGCGLEFRAFPGDPRILDAARWQRGGTGPIGAVRLVRLIADHMRELNTGILAAARQGADVLLLAGMSTIGGYHIAEGLGLASMGLGLQPVYPPADLENFLNAGPPPVFIGFGSMTPADHDHLSDLVATAGRQAGVRMVIQAGRPGGPGPGRPAARRFDHCRRGAARLALPADGGGDPSCGRGHSGGRAPCRSPCLECADDRRPAVLGRPARRPWHGATAHPLQAALRPGARGSHPGRDHPSVLPGSGAGDGQPAGHRGRHGSNHQCAYPSFELTIRGVSSSLWQGVACFAAK